MPKLDLILLNLRVGGVNEALLPTEGLLGELEEVCFSKTVEAYVAL